MPVPVLVTTISPEIDSPGLALSSPARTVISAPAEIGITLNTILSVNELSLDENTLTYTSEPPDGAPLDLSEMVMVTDSVEEGAKFTEAVSKVKSYQVLALLLLS